MTAKLVDPVDPALSFHPLLGDTAKLRELAASRGTSVAAVLRDAVHGYITDREFPPRRDELADIFEGSRTDHSPDYSDVLARSVALGHVDPPLDLDLDSLADALGGGQ